MAASGNIHPGRVSMFEPVHGSAPKYAGTGRANPFGAILTAGLMLDHLGTAAGGRRRRDGRRGLRPRGPLRPRDVGGSLSTSAAGDAVCERLRLRSP